jgi:hypothetical protein
MVSRKGELALFYTVQMPILGQKDEALGESYGRVPKFLKGQGSRARTIDFSSIVTCLR